MAEPLRVLTEGHKPLAGARPAQSSRLRIANQTAFSAQRFLEPFELGMCLDIGHANLCAATHNDYLGYLDQLHDRVPIIHVHAHENWGEADTHLTLFSGPSGSQGQGVQGLLRRLRARGCCGSLILEQWPQPPPLLNRARDRLLKIWNALGEPATPGSSQHGPGS